MHTEQGTQVKLTLPTIQPVCLAAALGTGCVVQAAVAVSPLFALQFGLHHEYHCMYAYITFLRGTTHSFAFQSVLLPQVCSLYYSHYNSSF